MSCNCNSGETPEYYITLDGVGADGYSPEINIVQEDTSSFKLNLINKNNEQITPAIPKLEYLNDTFVTNDALNTTLEDYSTTVEMNTALDLKLNKDGSNATNPITLNNFRVQSVGTGTRVGSEGQLTLYGSTARPAYLQTGSTSKSLALLSDVPTVTNKLETDGSNATSNIAINGITFRNQSNYNNIIKAKDGLNLELSNGGSIVDNTRATISLNTNGNVQLSGDNNINLSAVNDIHFNTTNGKVYYGATTDATKEIATLGNINNATITLTQGGVVKGSFTLNQSGSATIALDSGGSTIGNQISLITEDNTRSLTIGVNNTTKEAFMTYDIIGGISFDLNLISGKTAPITLTKNSDGTYSVGLDYDNDTLKVNQNGKLYADIEAPTYTAGTGIDINNEEISVDSDYIEAHKAYKSTGELLTDPQGLQDVIYYNQSSFDLSKFNVVGTPTITDDGIVSGFSTSNYITIDTSNIDFASANTWEIDFKIRLNNNTTATQMYFDTFVTGISSIIRFDYYNPNNENAFRLMVNSSDNTRIFNYAIIKNNIVTNTWYEFKLIFTGTHYIVKDADGNQLKDVESSKKVNLTSRMLVGKRQANDQPVTDGSIDLKQFSITVDGQEVFSGNNTGVDIIKPDNYTVVGSPTISANGIASGFSANNYLIATLTSDFASTPWFVEMKFLTTDISTRLQPLFLYNGYNRIFISPAGQITIFANSSSSSTNAKSVNCFNSGDIAINTNYSLRVAFDGTNTYNLTLTNLGTGEVKTDTKTFAYSFPSGSYTYCVGSDRDRYLSGTLDLNAFKIYVDGNLVYQPCLKIPYTLSKTGSKVVDVTYRDRVNDMAEQFGYAPYYTLDETNVNFTLPMGEIYGYITRLEGIIKDLQTRLTALESNIDAGGAGVVQQGLLGMSPLSLGRPQLLGGFNPEDEMDTMDIEPVEDDIQEEEIEEEPQGTEEETEEGGQDE